MTIGNIRDYTASSPRATGLGGERMSVKAQVLAALDGAQGRYLSGQELAEGLGVSRTAVWKAISALRADGYPIDAVTNRGYALRRGTDVLNAGAVRALLEPGCRVAD